MSIILTIIKEIVITFAVLVFVGLIAYGAGVLTQGGIQ
jgi:hypothetical protein